jgi:hypothetical protein
MNGCKSISHFLFSVLLVLISTLTLWSGHIKRNNTKHAALNSKPNPPKETHMSSHTRKGNAKRFMAFRPAHSAVLPHSEQQRSFRHNPIGTVDLLFPINVCLLQKYLYEAFCKMIEHWISRRRGVEFYLHSPSCYCGPVDYYTALHYI